MRRNYLQYLAGGSWSFFKKTFALIIGVIFYKLKYLRGKEFDGHRYSNGWRYVAHNFFMQKIVGINRKLPFPADFRSTFMNWENIEFDSNDISNFNKTGCYFQAASDAKISIGSGTWIACNVGIITANHDIRNLNLADSGKDVIIGKSCWIGMNSVILPGVVLGNHTVVGAGSVVTKSFPEGNCIIAGNPAKIIREIDAFIARV